MSRKKDTFSVIGKEILQGIEKQGITKADLCRKMDISRSTLYSWLYGYTAPDHNDLQKVYKILDVKSEQVKQPRHMRDIIEDDNYIGMHKRVYDALDESLATFQELARQAQKNVNDLTRLLEYRSKPGNGHPQGS